MPDLLQMHVSGDGVAWWPPPPPPPPPRPDYAAWWDFAVDSADGWTTTMGSSSTPLFPVSVVDGVLVSDFRHTGSGSLDFVGLRSPNFRIDFNRFDCATFVPYIEYSLSSEAVGDNAWSAGFLVSFGSTPNVEEHVTLNNYLYEGYTWGTWNKTPYGEDADFPEGIMWLYNSSSYAPYFAANDSFLDGKDLHLFTGALSKDEVNSRVVAKIRRCGIIDADAYYNSQGEEVRPVELKP